MLSDAPFNLRELLEESIAAVLAAETGLPAVTRKTAPGTFQQATPRLEVKCAIGSTTGHRKAFDDGTMKFDAFRFQLAVQSVTAPSNDADQNVLNGALVSRVRNSSSSLAQASWTDLFNFPLIYIAEPLRETGQDDRLQSDKGIEFSTIGFDGIVCIRDAAWTN